MIVALLLFSTILSTIVTSDSNIFDNSKNLNDEQKGIFKKLFESKSIADRILDLKEKLKNGLSRLKESFSTDDNTKSLDSLGIVENPKILSVVETFRSYIALRNSDSRLTFITFYNGNQTVTEFDFFNTIFVDVNNDGSDDVSARMALYPYIEKPLCFSIRFKLIINRIEENFPDENADFSAYAELTFLGLLNENTKGDKIRFGYSSPPGEEVPDSCFVTYKYLPHVFSLKRPEHRLEINPGSSSGKDTLILFFNYLNMDNSEVVSELSARISYSPATKAEISIWGTGLLGGSEYNFEREESEDCETQLYCIFEKNSSFIYGYVWDLPKKVTFNIDGGRDGFAEFNTYGEPPERIGLTAEANDHDNEIYFENLPSKARIEWTRDLIFDQEVNVNFYTDSEGISLKGHFESETGGVFDFDISSHEHLDCSMELDLAEGYFSLYRTDVDISVSLDADGAVNGSFHLSFDLDKKYNSPFEIWFNKLVDGQVEVNLTSKFFTLDNFYLMVNTSKVNVGLKADKITLEDFANLSILLKWERDEQNVTFNLSLYGDSNFSFYSLSLYFNGVWSNTIGFISFDGNRYHSIQIRIEGYDFDYYIAPDGSWGYFFIRGSIAYETYRTFMVYGKEVGFKGRIYAASDTDGLNISWYTDQSKGYNLTKLNVSGLIFGLENFNFYYSDIINLSISKLNGAIELREACNESGFFGLDLSGDHSNLEINFKYSISNETLDIEFGILKFISDVQDTSASIDAAWENKSLRFLDIFAETNLNISLQDMDLFIRNESGEMITIDNVTADITGYHGLEVNLTFPINLLNTNHSKYVNLSEETFAFIFIDSLVYVHIDFVNITGVDLGEIELFGESVGKTVVSVVNISYNRTYDQYDSDFMWINSTINFDCSGGTYKLNRLVIEGFNHILTLILKSLGLDIAWPVKTELYFENLTIDGSSCNLTLGLGWFVYPGMSLPLYYNLIFENAEDTTLEIEKITFIFPEFQNTYSFNKSASFFLKDIVIVHGIFDVMIPLWSNHMGINISEASGLERVDVGISIEGYIDLFFSFNEPIEYFDFGYNGGYNLWEETYLYAETLNTTVTCDGYLLASKEGLNILADIINETLNIEMPYVENDVGIWLDNNTIQADRFKLFLNITDEPKENLLELYNGFEGYLHVVAGGDVYLWVNGSWQLYIAGDVATFECFPGYLRIEIHAAFVETPFSYSGMGGEHYQNEISFSGIFDITAPNVILELWWGLEEGMIVFNGIRVAGIADVIIQNFSLNIYDTYTLKNTTFTADYIAFRGTPYLLDAKVFFYEENFIRVNGSVGASVQLENAYLHTIDPYNIEKGCSNEKIIELPNFDVTLTGETPFFDLLFRPPFIIFPRETSIYVNGTVQYRALFNTMPLVQWFSDEEDVAVIDDNGLATGKSIGTCNITAWSGGDKATAILHVIAEPEFSISPSEETIAVGQRLQIGAGGDYEPPLNWSSSEPDIVSVDSKGLIYANKTGSVTITATDNNSQTAEAHITVIEFPSEINQSYLYLNGDFLINGSLQLCLGIFPDSDYDGYVLLCGFANGSAIIKNIDFRYKVPSGNSSSTIDVLIPNVLEIQDGFFEFSKENETDQAEFFWGGNIKILPGKSAYGTVGIDIRATNIVIKKVAISDFRFSLESFFLNAFIIDSDGPSTLGDPGSVEPSEDGEGFSLLFDPISRKVEFESRNDSITCSFSKLNFSCDFELNNRTIGIRTVIGSFDFSKIGRFRWILDVDYEGNFSDPQGENGTSMRYMVNLTQYTNFNSSFRLQNFSINLLITKENGGIINFKTPLISNLNFSKCKKGYGSIIYEVFTTHRNLTFNMDTTLNSTWIFEKEFGEKNEGVWQIDGKFSGHFMFHTIRGYILEQPYHPIFFTDVNCYVYSDLAFLTMIKITRTGGLLGYWEFSLGPIQLSPGLIEFFNARNEEETEGWLDINNHNIYGNGEILKFETGILKKNCSITFGSFQLKPGHLNFTWNKEIDEYILNNTDFDTNFGLLECKFGNLIFSLGDIILKPAVTKFKFNNVPQIGEGFISVDNNLGNPNQPIRISIFKLMFDFPNRIIKLIDKVGIEYGLEMDTGIFNFSWSDAPNASYDREFKLRNGVFKCYNFAISIFNKTNSGDLELLFDLFDIDNTNNDNIITVMLKNSGGSAIYINSTDYIKLALFGVSAYLDTTKLFEITSFVNLKIKFDECYLGNFGSGLEWGGKIRFGVGSGLIEFFIDLLFRDENGDYQEVNFSGFGNEQKANLKIDATECYIDMQHEWASFQIGRFIISLSSEIKAEKFIELEFDYNLTPTPEEGNTGHFYAYVDTDGEDLIDELLTLTILRDGIFGTSGLKFIATGFNADQFNISCDSKQNLQGKWVPKWSTLDSTGDIDGAGLEIWVKFISLDDFVKIYDEDGLVVITENQGQSYEIVMGQTLEFYVYVFGGTQPYTYSWILPGGESVESQNSSYTFYVPGDYLIVVDVEDVYGLTGNATSKVRVLNDLNGTLAL